MAGERIRLEVQEREQRGSRDSRRLRKDGLIPGVLYGRGNEPHAISVPERELRRVLTGAARPARDPRRRPGRSRSPTHSSILKDYQVDPIRGKIEHFDLQEVRLDQAIQTAVVVELVGESAGAKAGGVLSQVTREIRVEALPLEVPERIELDVSAMEIGDTLRLSDLPRERGRDLPRRSGDGARHRDGADARRGARAGRRGGRGGRGRGGRGGAGGRRRGRRGRGRRRPASPTRPKARTPCPSSVGAARPPRRSTCSSPGSATLAASTRRTRHNVGWMVVDELARRHGGSWRSKFSGQLAEVRVDAARLALRQARDVHERVGPLDRGRGAVLQGAARVGARRPRRRRPRRGPAAGAARRRSRRAQRAALDRRASSARRTSCGCGSASGGRAAATVARLPTTCSRRSTPETDVAALVGARGRRRRDDSSADGARGRRSSASTDALPEVAPGHTRVTRFEAMLSPTRAGGGVVGHSARAAAPPRRRTAGPSGPPGSREERRLPRRAPCAPKLD